MRAIGAHWRPLAVVTAIVVLGSSVLVLTACNGEKADDWVAIHANRIESSSTPGGTVDRCDVPAGNVVAFLPKCMAIKAGDKIGFVNYYNVVENHINIGRPVVVKLDPAIFGVAEFTLEYQESKVVEVKITPTMFSEIRITTPAKDHGGPVMIPKS